MSPHQWCAFAAVFVSRCVAAQPAPEVAPLFAKPLPDLAGKEALMLTVEYPPGGVDRVHRHDAHAFVYVLEGSIVMQVEGGEQVTLTAGQTFYEGPDDIHIVGRNASGTQRARFVVVLIKNVGVPPVLPVSEKDLRPSQRR